MIHNILLLAGLNIYKGIEFLWLIIMCIYSGREMGSAIDKENRNSAGKPAFIFIPDKWKWLFRNRVNTYAGKNKILRVSFIIQLLGYLFAFFEIVLFVSFLFCKKERLTTFSFQLYIFYALISIFLGGVSSYIYERNMQTAYDYDWITYFQEAFSLYSKRSCRIIDKKNESTYEIVIGAFCKHKYLATAECQVEIGEKKYAIHVYDKAGPYWIIRSF